MQLFLTKNGTNHLVSTKQICSKYSATNALFQMNTIKKSLTSFMITISKEQSY